MRRLKPGSLPRVRHEPPTIEEAIFAAQGLTDDGAQQVELAASLMGVSEGKVKLALAMLQPRFPPRIAATVHALPRARRFVVERKEPRALSRAR